MHVFPAGFGGGGCGDDLGLRYSNQVSVLCEALLNAHFVDRPLWAAMVRIWYHYGQLWYVYGTTLGSYGTYMVPLRAAMVRIWYHSGQLRSNLS